jgi:hypothetical protein
LFAEEPREQLSVRQAADFSLRHISGSRTSAAKERYMSTILIILVVLLLVGGGGFYGRGRWY